MVIGIDASQANREKRSGTEWYAFYLIQEFKELLRDKPYIKVRLYFRTAPRRDIKKDLPDNFELKVLRWPIRHFWAQGRLSLEMLFFGPDILFSPAHTIPLIHPQKTFTTLHDIGFEDNPELYDKLSLWYHRFSAKLAVKKAKHIFTISEFSKKRIVDVFAMDPERVSVIYLGYDREKYRIYNQNEINPVLKKHNLRYKKYMLFVGRLEPKKNILRIVKAFDELANRPGDLPDLVFAGLKIDISDTETYLSSRVEFGKRVKFLGYVEEKEKPALYAGASVFVFPTLYEGFGMPILEAQACGTPVLTSNSTSNEEVAGAGAVIVDPKNVQQISNKLKEILDSEEKQRELVRLGLENIKRFNWQRTANKTLDKILS